MESIEIFNNYILYSDGSVYSRYKGRFIKFSPDKKGYYTSRLIVDGKPKTVKLHRLVGENFVDNPHNYAEINHIDGDKSNNHVNNLEWCSRGYNLQHAWDLELRVRPNGGLNGRATISEETAIGICEDIIGKHKTCDIARKYGVKWHIVDSIRRGKTWKHVSIKYFDNVM